MTKKFNRKIFVICLSLILVIALSATSLAIIFTLRQKEPASYDAYTGYDGYIWYGPRRSNERSDEQVAEADAFEHTLEVADVMAAYFSGGYIDLANSYAALLPHYKKYSQTVIFSDMQIKNITVFAGRAGTLDVGVADIANVVNSRATGQPMQTEHVHTFSVKRGKTSISFETPLRVGTHQTLVLGGNDSVPLYYAKDIPVDDEAGNFTHIDGLSHGELLQNSGGGNYPDTLAIEVKVVTQEEKPVFADLRGQVNSAVGNLSTMKNTADNSWGAYIYNDENLFSGKTITKIGVPVKTLMQVNGRTYLDLYLIDSFEKPTSPDAVAARNFEGDTAGAQEFLNEHRTSVPLEITAENLNAEFENLARQNDGGYGWVYFDCHIEVGKTQTLAFGGGSNGVRWCFLNSTSDGVDLTTNSQFNKYKIIGKVGNGMHGYDGNPDFQNYMFFDVYYLENYTLESQIEMLNSMENAASGLGKLREVLSGKQISILGDSISTYEGYSNEYETQNSDIKGNGRWKEPAVGHDDVGNKQMYFEDKTGIYDNEYNNKTNFKQTLDVPSVSDTWWMSTIERTNMNLCVNNSFAGGLITDNVTIKRSAQLHDNTYGDDKNPGQTGEIYPDIVAIYMGTNDFNSRGNVEPDAFYNAYKRIILNIFKNYMAHSPDLKIFVFTLPPSIAGESKWCKGDDYNGLDEVAYTQNLQRFNDKIRQIAAEINNVEVVDLFEYCNMTRAEMHAFANDAIHPNAAGMNLISNCFISTLITSYGCDV